MKFITSNGIPQLNTVEKNIPTTIIEISKYTCSLTFFGKINSMGIIENMNGLMFATGSVFKKFQRAGSVSVL